MVLYINIHCNTSIIYHPLLTSVQPISMTKTLLIVPTKNERDPPLFTGKLLIKFQNILRNTIGERFTREKYIIHLVHNMSNA